MWCDVQSPAMMGLQATASKRKLEYESSCPSKVVRLEEGSPGEATAVDDWCLGGGGGGVLASSVLGAATASAVGVDDDDEEDDEEKGGRYLPAGRGFQCVGVPSPCYSLPADLKYYGDEQGYSGCPPFSARPQPYPPPQRGPPSGYWGGAGAGADAPGGDYYAPAPGPQQTIRCDENGKSYLDLGSSSARYVSPSAGRRASPEPRKCCDGGRTSWCGQGPGAACYRQRRLAVLNISMCKLGRYRQFPDPSLLRSVLICNTLRHIEREMEQEGFFFNSGPLGGAPAPPAGPPPAPLDPEPSYHPHYPEVPPANVGYAPPYRVANPSADVAPPYEQNLRELSASGRATPFPGVGLSPAYECDSDSGVGDGDDDSGRGINWGSVLSLSSQSDLDPLNNNELYPSSPSPSAASPDGSLGLLGDMDLGHEFDDFLPSWKLTPLSADDILKSVPSSELAGRQEGEMDIMHVLVGT